MGDDTEVYRKYTEAKEETEEDRVAEHYNLSLRSWRDLFDREFLKKFLTYSKKVQIIIVILVILDCTIVLIELLIDLGVIIKNDCEKNEECPPLNRTIVNATENIHACTVGPSELSHCEFYHGRKRCISEETTPSIDPATVLHTMGIVVLGLFLVEIILKLYALRLEFFHHKLEVFDALVVIVSFSLDVAVSGNEEAWEGAELLIILRLWRVARIANGAIISVKKEAEKKAEHLQIKVDKLQEENKKLRDTLGEAKVEGLLGKQRAEDSHLEQSLHVPGDGPHYPSGTDHSNM